jgi:hypothetical protein
VLARTSDIVAVLLDIYERNGDAIAMQVRGYVIRVIRVIRVMVTRALPAFRATNIRVMVTHATTEPLPRV